MRIIASVVNFILKKGKFPFKILRIIEGTPDYRKHNGWLQ